MMLHAVHITSHSGLRLAKALSITILLGGVISNAQTTDTAPSETSFTVDFPINDHRVIPSFGNNRATIDSLTTPPGCTLLPTGS